MTEEFNQAMKDFFGAVRGAFSVITNDEFSKSQVTFVGPEQRIAEELFGYQLVGHHGNRDMIRASGIDPELPYRLFPSGRIIKLTTAYKRNKPRELRYYSKADVFKPSPGEYWGIFERHGQPWLCHFSPKFLEEIRSGRLTNVTRDEILEAETDEYQTEVNGPPEQLETRVKSWKRSIKVAQSALLAAKFRCELFPEFPVFTSRTTGKPFMEAHHLVPMQLQDRFDTSLDVTENICCVGPLAHRMVHYGIFDIFEDRLAKIIQERREFIRRIGLLDDDVMAIYSR